MSLGTAPFLRASHWLRRPVAVALASGCVALVLSGLAVLFTSSIREQALSHHHADLAMQATLLALYVRDVPAEERPAALRRFHGALGEHADTVLGLLDGQGHVIAQYPDRPPLQGLAAALADRDHAGTTRVDPGHLGDEVERLAAHAYMPVTAGAMAASGPPGMAVVAVPEIEVSGATRRDQLIVIAAAVALAVIIGILGGLLARKARAAQEAAEQLGRREVELRQLFDHATEGIYRSALNGRILRASPAMARMHGYDDESHMMALRDTDRRPWFIDPERARVFFETLLRDGVVRGFESEVCRRHTGERFWAMENAWLVRDAEGNPTFFEGTVQDVTERRTVETNLRRAQADAEQSSRTKSSFLANMSHELRTPLNAIIGFSEVLEAGIAGPLTPRQAEYVGDVLTSGRHLLEVINDILDLSKIEAGHLDLAEQHLDLEELLEDCTAMLQPLAARKGIAVVTPHQGDPTQAGPSLLADQHRLRQMLLNLLSNAIKFTDPGGRVTLGWHRRGDGGLSLAVSDTGQGMSAEEVEVALIPFRQVDAALSRRHEGTGLGLPLVKILVERHGGTLEIESVKDRGTCVTLNFPAWRSQPDKAA
ncbi:ATP-binding protein [Zavarzinia sp. CC-PAN008]|uniref:ATP-binding protein n=1 Tax=Zavarzinia sp. CC-PAN008 TaxID=3243332 RepID=UPI003F7428EF